jgi:adenylate cyclase
MAASRRLAAILAADVVGYSRLMGEDEEGTLAALKTLWGDLSHPKIKEHNGRIVKTTGDGLLVEFGSVVDAVRCAVEVQREMAERNTAIPAERRIEFRMGINLGDIIKDRGDIYGDGVNVAARLEALAEPGGICVSRVDQVRDKLDFVFEDRGEQQVKNIARPVRVFDVRTAAEGPTMTPDLPAAAPLPLPEKPSIAVLPFQNLSGDAEQEYFADGIVEDIITALSRNRAFFVISRNTTFTHKGPAVDVARVARELGVRYVLEGSVRRAGNRVRITAQLIDAASGRHLWADRYDREMADVFAVQDEIAQTITGELAPGIIAAEMQQARRKDPSQLDAWDRTMRAHWHIGRFTREDVAEGSACSKKRSNSIRRMRRRLAIFPLPSISPQCSAGLTIWQGHLSAAARWRAGRSRSMMVMPTPIPRWQSTICSRAGTRKPGAGCAAPSISTATRCSRAAISA